MDKLHLSEHISQQFNEELEDVRSKVLQMGGMVEDQLANAVNALISGDIALAKDVVAQDKAINAMELEIDEDCTRIVARRQPAATDLRLVMAVIRTINDLERMGDEVKRIGKMVGDELDGILEEDVRLEIEYMGGLVRGMLHDVLDAFARTDAQAAVDVARTDKKVDAKYRAITRHLMTYMAQDHGAIPNVLNILWAARALERLGDRCQNIAEYVIYLVLGRDVRHHGLDEVMAELGAQTD